MTDKLLSVRVPADLIERIDVHAADVGMGRSEMVRVLLETALDEDIDNALVKQAIRRLGKPMRIAVGRILNRIAGELPDEILRAIDELGFDGSGRPGLPPEHAGGEEDVDEGAE